MFKRDKHHGSKHGNGPAGAHRHGGGCTCPKAVMEPHPESRSKSATVSPMPAFPLILAQEGERVKICGLRGKGALKERLLSMGIKLGDEIRVIRKQHRGAVLIEAQGVRYTLGGGMPGKINVTGVK